MGVVQESNSFDEVINNFLKLNGDTDTIGAIAGSIAGSYYGVSEKHRKEVENKQLDNIFNTALKSLLS